MVKSGPHTSTVTFCLKTQASAIGAPPLWPGSGGWDYFPLKFQPLVSRNCCSHGCRRLLPLLSLCRSTWTVFSLTTDRQGRIQQCRNFCVECFQVGSWNIGSGRGSGRNHKDSEKKGMICLYSVFGKCLSFSPTSCVATRNVIFFLLFPTWFCVIEGLYWFEPVLVFHFSSNFFLKIKAKSVLRLIWTKTLVALTAIRAEKKTNQNTLFIYVLFFFYFQLHPILMFRCLSGVSGRSHSLKWPLFSGYCNFLLRKSCKETALRCQQGERAMFWFRENCKDVPQEKWIVRDV